MNTFSPRIWSQKAGLVLKEENLGIGQEWARQVREVRPGEAPQMIATDIGTLLEKSGYDRISILKVDIEGSEAKVFSENYEGWIDRVDTLLIETHSEECEAVFRRAMVGRGFSISAHQSLWVGVAARQRARSGPDRPSSCWLENWNSQNLTAPQARSAQNEA